MKTRSLIRRFILVAATHFFLTAVCFVFSFNLSGVDGQTETGVELHFGRLLKILTWPLVAFILNHPGSFAVGRFHGLWGWIPFIVNSAIWSAGVSCFLVIGRNYRRSRLPHP